MDKRLLLRYLDCRRSPVEQHEDASRMHNALFEGAPDFYLHLLTDPQAHVSHKREILLNLLQAEAEARQKIERQRMLDTLNVIPLAQGLQVIGVIYDLRINRSRARELVLNYVLGHELLPELAAIKRQRVSHLLRHVLGERTWSSMRRFLANPTPEGEQFLQREVLRYAWKGDVARLREVLCFLTGVPFTATLLPLVKIMSARHDITKWDGLPVETLSGIRGTYHRKVSFSKVRKVAAPVPVTTLEDGPLTAAYKEALGQDAAPAEQASSTLSKVRKVLGLLMQRVDAVLGAQEISFATELGQIISKLPLIDARIALVLDLSASMAAVGERRNHPAALGLALTRLLRERVSDLHLFQTGGSTGFDGDVVPQLQGVADLAQALLEAANSQSQMILIVTDGYENLRQGDTASMVEGLRQLGYDVPIYQVVPQFTGAEKLDLRRLGENIPLIPVAHEGQVNELLARALLTGAGEQLEEKHLQQLQLLLTEE
jgi:hypothetical protein